MYVDAIFNREKDSISLVERIKGQRVYKTIPANYVFFYPDPKGSYKNIHGDQMSKFSSNSYKLFQREKALMYNKNLCESDIQPLFRCLEENYRHSETPELHIGFFDIEVAFDTKRGFAPITDPFNNITAISIYLNWMNKMVTMVMPPPTMTMEEAQKVVDQFEDTFLFDDEKEMCRFFLDLVQECDVVSGWNSTGFDIPYLVNRITKIMSKEETKKFCLWDQFPKKREYFKFKKKSITYDLVGIVHLDYLELYQKHNPQQLHSYRLDFVGEIEVKENKIPYEGTLDDLYKKDFMKFIEYNRQDTLLLHKIDAKKKFIELANQIAHTNTVLLKTTMGSVALIENSITLEAHDRGMVIPDRKHAPAADEDDEDYDDEDDEDGDKKKPAVGAYVAKPKTGLHEEIGCCDINSLYPSALRALNMSPETLVGHIRPERTTAMIDERIAKGVPRAELWNDVFCTLEYESVRDRTKDVVFVDFEDGTSLKMRADELNDYIYHEGRALSITANGTIFRTDIDGVIPSLLATWYSQRKQMQAREKTFSYVLDPANSIQKSLDGDPSDFISELTAELKTATKTDIDVGLMLKSLAKKKAKEVASIMVACNFELVDGCIVPKDKTDAKYWKTFWNQRQQARKILLNSLYGALLNESMKFYDKRIGQSVTLCGRSIAKHMNSKINEIITGTYDYKGEAIIYADTDSSYFSAKSVWSKDPAYEGFEFTRENIIQLYDGIGDTVNESFPEFMNKAFNTGLERGAIIAAGRELVASKGLFIKKKKYAVLMYDKENVRYDIDGKPGELKVMGLDLKRSDTPQFMQDFLEEILMDLLTDKTQAQIFEKIKTFRTEFRGRPGWEKGTPKKVNGLTDYSAREDRLKNVGTTSVFNINAGEKSKLNIPGHVRAGINWNTLRKMNNDMFSMEVTDGMKTIVCKLKPNPMKMDSIGYPTDEPHIPFWFKNLPFDNAAMEETIIDYKLSNLLGVLGWDLSQANDDLSNDLFTW